MIKYRHLHRHPIDEYFHKAMFIFYSMLTTLIPFSTELRTYVTVVAEAIANLNKFFFRPGNEANIIIEEYEAEVQL